MRLFAVFQLNSFTFAPVKMNIVFISVIANYKSKVL